MKLDVLVFAAHPDDAELSIAGTIASLSSKGKKVGIVDLTQGEMGTRGTVETRFEEAAKASGIMGLAYRSNLNLGDSLVENTRENQLAIIREIRKTQPTICITGAPHDRHPDHGKATRLVIDALFYSGLQKIQTEDKGKVQEPWRPAHILQYMQDQPIEYDFVYDVTDHWETKIEAMKAYGTQVNVNDPGNEPETYISSSQFFKQLEARAVYFGHLAGFKYGEPFKYHNSPVGIKDLDFLFQNQPKR